jgi:hypothetical protein
MRLRSVPGARSHLHCERILNAATDTGTDPNATDDADTATDTDPNATADVDTATAADRDSSTDARPHNPTNRESRIHDRPDAAGGLGANARAYGHGEAVGDTIPESFVGCRRRDSGPDTGPRALPGRFADGVIRSGLRRADHSRSPGSRRWVRQRDRRYWGRRLGGVRSARDRWLDRAGGSAGRSRAPRAPRRRSPVGRGRGVVADRTALAVEGGAQARHLGVDGRTSGSLAVAPRRLRRLCPDRLAEPHE